MVRSLHFGFCMNKPIRHPTASPQGALRKKRFLTVALLGALLMPTVVHADVYMQQPRGSNNRLNGDDDKAPEPSAFEVLVEFVRSLF